MGVEPALTGLQDHSHLLIDLFIIHTANNPQVMAN